MSIDIHYNTKIQLSNCIKQPSVTACNAFYMQHFTAMLILFNLFYPTNFSSIQYSIYNFHINTSKNQIKIIIIIIILIMKESLTYISYFKKIMSTAHVVPKCACILFTPQIRNTLQNTQGRKRRKTTVFQTHFQQNYIVSIAF